MPVDFDIATLNGVATRISSGVPRATRVTAEQGKAVAIRYCPVSPGAPSHGDAHLVETIRVVGVNQYAVDLVAGGLGQPHGPMVEFGTYRAPAQPFMGPAAAEMKAQLMKNVRKEIGL